MSNRIHAKITPILTDEGLIHLKIEWINVWDNVPGNSIFTEEFQMSPQKGEQGCAYVSRVCIEKAETLPGTFWLDEKGLRHFTVSADAGELLAVGIDNMERK